MATIEPNFESICINPNDDLVLYKKEIVRSRIEKFLYAICSLDTDDLPTPLSRMEELYNCLVTGGDILTFTPLSRAEKFVMAMLGAYDVELLPTPISRSETLMKKIATGDNNLDDIVNLQSRYEFLLAYIIKAGGFNGGSGDFYYNLTSLTSSFTTIYGTLDKPVKNAVLRGQTLVNLVKKLSDENVGNSNKVWQTQGSGQVTYSYDVNKGVTLSNTVKGSMVLNYVDLTLFKPNTEYTLFIDVNWNGVGIIPHFTKLTTKEIQLNNGLNIIKFTTISDLTVQNACLRLGYAGTIAVGCEYTFNNIMVLEGDWTNVDISYFEGMASVKMPVLTTVGKNLFDINKFKGIGIDEQGYYIPLKFVDNSAAKATLKLKPNTKYVITGTYIYTGKARFNFRINDGAYRNMNDYFETDATGVVNIKIGSNNVDVSDPSKMEKIMIVESTLKDIYEPFKSNILTCNEEVSLRGIGDIKDELNLTTGEYTKAVYEYTFTGNEYWEIGGGATGGYTYFQCKLNQLPINYKYKTDANIPISCNRLPVITYNDFDGRLKNVGINLTYFFRLNFSDCNSNNGATVEDLKAYLKANPTTVQYPISKSIKTVDLSTLNQDGKETKLRTFDDITHVTVSSEGLVPTGDIDIARPIQFVDYSLGNGWVTLYNTIDRPVKNAVLRGKTLKNLSPLTGVTTLKPGNAIFIENTGMKTNTTYTIMFNCSNVPSTNFVEIRTMMDNTQITQVQQNVSARYNKFAIKTHTSKETNRFRFKNDTTSTTDFIFSELVILEGDYTNENISYFEGMASVKMPVLTTVGKNLFDGELKVGGLASNGAVDYNFSNRIVSYNFIPIKNNMQYKLSSADNLLLSRVCFYDNNKQIISESYTTDFISPTNAKYLKFAFMNTENIESQIMLEEGSTASTYEPYKTNILTCNEEVELRRICDIKDELNLVTGELTQHIQERVFDGSENWIIGGTGDNYIMFRCESYTDMAKSSNVITCDRYEYNKLNNATSNLSVTNSTTTGKICIVTSQKDLSIDNFKAKLNTDKPTIQYQLAEPIVKTVDLSTLDRNEDILLILENGDYIITENGNYINVSTKSKETKLSTFDDITHVTVSSEGLIPTGEITVATKNATDVIDASVMSLRMDDILNSQGTLEGSANAQSDDIDIAMLGTTDIYEQLL